MESKQEKLEEVARQLLSVIGEDVNRSGLVGTPRRWAKMWMEFTEHDPGTMDTCFESVTTNQMVVVSGMRVWSMCEHHLLPFWCDIAVGYIARDHVLGLSKFARIAHHFAHRLQLQEQLVHQIADEVERVTMSPDVAVLGRGEHLCMTMRGIKTPSIMVSSVMRGIFLEGPSARSEFLQTVDMADSVKR